MISVDRTSGNEMSQSVAAALSPTTEPQKFRFAVPSAHEDCLLNSLPVKSTMKPESMGTLQSGHAGDRCGTIPPLRRHRLSVADLTTSMHGSEHSNGIARDWTTREIDDSVAA